MAKLRSLSTAFWSDPFVEDLEPKEKLLFIYLITNEKTNMLGIYESSNKKISFETGLTIEEVFNGLKAFEKIEKVKRIGNYIVLINFMKHQNYNTNMKKSAIDTYNSLPKELKSNSLDVVKDKPIKGFESLLNHYGMVRKIEVEYEVEKESNLYIETTNNLTQEHFLKRWSAARLHYDKQPTNIRRLTTFEIVDFKELLRDYNAQEFDQAIQGLFQQTTFPKTRLRPTHFLKREHFETYLTCFTTKEKLFDNNKYKKIDRI